jgi:hypothetical protein
LTFLPWSSAHGFNYSIQIVASVFDTSVMRIAKEVVHPVSVHLTGNKISPKDALACLLALQQCGHIVCPEAAVLVECVVLNSILKLRTYYRCRVCLMFELTTTFSNGEQFLASVRKGSVKL